MVLIAISLSAGLLLYVKVAVQPILIISLAILALLYFLRAYEPPKELSAENGPYGFATLLVHSILPKILWISSACGVVALAFFFADMAGYKKLSKIAVLTIFIALVILLLASLAGSKSKFNYSILFRVIPLLVIDVYLVQNG